ncbi:MAG: biotin--[acetyl-CoA-carboxylase] ligase [Prevotella sp.]
MRNIRHIHLSQTDSTNRYSKGQPLSDRNEMLVVSADFQTAGRGQGSNTWESEAGKNLMFSVKFNPRGVPAARQYILLQAAAVALCEIIAARVSDEVSIKWPNDIYAGNRKISGTLSECTLTGSCIDTCILGIGINVNQRQFTSDAPNPVSLCQLTGATYDRNALLEQVLERMAWWIGEVDRGHFDRIHACYMQHLYRREGTHPYRDSNGFFKATVQGLTPYGHLLLRKESGEVGEYAFKEVQFVL